MAFLNDFGKKLSTAAELTVDKAKDLAETGKTKLDIAAEEKEIKELYAKIGEAVFLLEKDNEESVYSAECIAIKEHMQKIDELKAQE